jgi:hypothetical protein
VPITHPAVLDTTYARTPVEPITRLRFTLTGAPALTVAPTGGTLRHDASRWPRTTLDATLPTTITPTLLPPALSAYGGRVRVTMGARVRGTEYLFTVATLAVATVRIDRPDAAVELTATSFEAIVNEDRFDTPTNTDAGTVVDVVSAIVRRSIPDVVVVNELGSVGATVLGEGAYVLDGDVWPIVERILDDVGGEAWFDELGRLRLRLVPVVKVTPDLVLAAGASLTGYQSTREWGPNRVALVYTTPANVARTRHEWVTATSGASAGKVGANAAPAAATRLYVHRLDAEGTDVGDAFAGLRPYDPGAPGPGDVVRLVDDDPALKAPSRVVYEVTAPATLAGDYWTIPVRVVRAVKHPDSPAMFPGGTALDVHVRIRPRRRVGTWSDTSPTSPTRVGGPYGRHTYREDLAVERGDLPSQADADAAALAMARRVVGRFRQVTARGVPAPWIVPGDTVRLGMLGGLTESHVVQSITHPLSGLDVVELTTRDAAYVAGPF